MARIQGAGVPRGDLPQRGILQSAKEGRMPAMRMLGNSLPERGNRMCKDGVIFTVLKLVMP